MFFLIGEDLPCTCRIPAVYLHELSYADCWEPALGVLSLKRQERCIIHGVLYCTRIGATNARYTAELFISTGCAAKNFNGKSQGNMHHKSVSNCVDFGADFYCRFPSGKQNSLYSPSLVPVRSCLLIC